MRKMPTKMSKFPVCIERSLHRGFKAMCAERGKLMSEVVRDLVRRELASAAAAPKTKPAKTTKAKAEDTHAV